MEDKVRLRVLGLSYQELQSGAYALVLAQENGPYRIPIVIGSPEAQSIAINMEGIIPPRPLTHDLFASFAQAFGVKLREVFIYKFEDGVFSSEMTFDDGERRIVLDSRTSDAVAIALRCKAPIYTTRTILSDVGFIIEDQEGEQEGDDTAAPASCEPETEREVPLENYAIEELERTLEKLIANEDYEQAAKVNSIIRRKKNQDEATE